ncbi:unnamed protein product [Periconia digitata]|uniref:Uncharacterized protein n=1 Tax=Periconia digitata TaxID=1303443 RepID=A0A9W4UUK7_9PLEO|nr:unnamed protein product [Periconia digitata]
MPCPRRIMQSRRNWFISEIESSVQFLTLGPLPPMHPASLGSTFHFFFSSPSPLSSRLREGFRWFDFPGGEYWAGPSVFPIQALLHLSHWHGKLWKEIVGWHPTCALARNQPPSGVSVSPEDGVGPRAHVSQASPCLR